MGAVNTRPSGYAESSSLDTLIADAGEHAEEIFELYRAVAAMGQTTQERVAEKYQAASSLASETRSAETEKESDKIVVAMTETPKIIRADKQEDNIAKAADSLGEIVQETNDYFQTPRLNRFEAKTPVLRRPMDDNPGGGGPGS